MWFDQLMDDCKRGLALVVANIWISLPYVIHAVIVFVLSILVLLFAAFFILYAGFSFDLNQDINWLHFIAGGLGIIAVTALISSILKALVEAGSISLFAAVADGAKPSARLFWSGVRIFFLPVWGMRLFLGLMCLLISPLIIALLALAMVAGVFSGGWAISAFGALVSVFLGAWPVALVLDKKGAFSALAAGFRLGKGYFWGMFLLFLAFALLTQQLAVAFGPFIAMAVGWALAMVAQAWLKMTIILIYKRKRAES
jgi:hypothetical protein